MESKTVKRKKRRVRKPKTFKDKFKGVFRNQYDERNWAFIILTSLLIGLFIITFFLSLMNPSIYMNMPTNASALKSNAK
jgi:uncharacterized membrane protein